MKSKLSAQGYIHQIYIKEIQKFSELIVEYTNEVTKSAKQITNYGELTYELASSIVKNTILLSDYIERANERIRSINYKQNATFIDKFNCTIDECSEKFGQNEKIIGECVALIGEDM